MVHVRTWSRPGVLRLLRSGVFQGHQSGDEVAPARSASTTRAGRSATTVVGRDARAKSDVANELRCGWHTVNKAVVALGLGAVGRRRRQGRCRGSVGV